MLIAVQQAYAGHSCLFIDTDVGKQALPTTIAPGETKTQAIEIWNNYKLYETKIKYSGIVDECKAGNGSTGRYGAHIPNAAMNEKVKGLAKGNPVWLGAGANKRYAQKDGTLEWEMGAY